MKRYSSKNAFTLIELIVSCLLVSVVLLGIVSINTVMSNNSQDFGQHYLVNSDTQTTLNHILNSASLAYGTGNSNDEAILIGAQVGDADTFCIHQLAANNLVQITTGAPTATDIWLCYSWTGALGTTVNMTQKNSIYWCAETYPTVIPAGNDPRTAGKCDTVPAANVVLKPTYLGSTFISPVTPAAPATPATFNNNTFSITLTDCLTNTAAAGCTAGGVSGNPSQNPEVQLSGSVQPKQASD